MSIQNLAGQTLGQYELRDLLGEGGMGAVYRAYQRNLNREVAIKVLPASLAAQSGYMERFTREAQTSAALEHPNIVPVHDYGTQGGISYVVMRLLTGGTLAERLTHSVEAGRPLPSLMEIAQITKQLASALDYAHSHGVIHRDIKANNIMFDKQGTPFIVDFGIAKLVNATTALTGTGVAMGTPSYMAPEQWAGGDIGPASDQYALAVLVYAMLTGKMPFEADSPYQLMHKHMFEQPTPLMNYRADLPEAVQAVFNKAFAKFPTERYANTSEFARALEGAVQSNAQGHQQTGFFLNPLPPRKLNIPLTSTPTPANLEGPTVTPPQMKVETMLQATIPDVPVGAGPTSPAPPSTIPGAAPTIPPTAKARRGWLPLAAVGLVVIVAIIAIVAIVVDGSDDDPNEGNQTADETAQAILTEFAVQSNTTTAAAETVVALANDATDTPSATATATSSDTPTDIAETSTPTATRTASPNAIATLEARATINFEQTSAAQGAQTTEEVEQPTSTPEPTDEPAATPPPTSSPTTAATATRRPSNTPATTATPTASFTPSATATATVDVEATNVAQETQQAATQNAVQTLAARATRDAEGTQSARATNEAGPTQTAIAIAAAIQIGEATREVNVRSGPGTDFDVVATLPLGGRVTILGASEDEQWLNVSLADGSTGWIRADLLTIVGPPTPTPTPSATPVSNNFEGVAMVLVPAGCFTMGSDETQLEYAASINTNPDVLPWEQPAHEICFETPFWIDQYEVTNAQFAAFNGQAGRENTWTDLNQPRANVTWAEADAFCEARGARLPNEAEWEYAARGPENRIFPWGNVFDVNNVIDASNSTEPVEVGSRPGGVSWAGAYDMAGNVWEWTSSYYLPYPFDATDGRQAPIEGANPVIRGGSYQDVDAFARTSMRAIWVPAETAVEVIGFRCIRDFEEQG
jgi:serine/threonine protein kinase/formylglycine-generating enzyme required for sulfatase activity